MSSDQLELLVGRVAAHLGITVEEAEGLTWFDLVAEESRMQAALDQQRAEAQDWSVIHDVVGRYPELADQGLTVGEMLPHMAPADADRVQEIGRRLESRSA